MADPLSKQDSSTREPWTDGGAEPITKNLINLNDMQINDLPVYEYKPAGLLRGRKELIVLALRCNPPGEGVGVADVDGTGSTDLDPLRKPCRGDVGQDVDCCIGANLDLDETFDDLRRNIPGFVSTLQSPNNIYTKKKTN